MAKDQHPPIQNQPYTKTNTIKIKSKYQKQLKKTTLNQIPQLNIIKSKTKQLKRNKSETTTTQTQTT